MYVYVWKHNETPFYVGMSKTAHRANPLNAGGRGWLCKQTLAKIGPKNVVLELRIVDTLEEAIALERSLIELYGRIQHGTGPLTNLKPGGDGSATMTDKGRAATSARMIANNPMHNVETRAKATARMQDPDVQEKLRGENNPAKRPEVREKLLAKWQDPEYKARQKLARTGALTHSVEFKEAARQRLLDPTNPMRDQHKILNTDSAIREKRNAALRSPEVRAKHKANADKRWADPAARIALGEKMKAIWAKRREAKVLSLS